MSDDVSNPRTTRTWVSRRVETEVPEPQSDAGYVIPTGARPTSVLKQLAAGLDLQAEAGNERFAVEEELGRGGMGRVVRVKDGDLHRDIAMKILLRGKDDQAVRRFVEEAQITSQLEHPSIPAVHDLGLDAEGQLFFTMQCVDAHATIADLVDQLRAGDAELRAAYTYERRVQIMLQACQVLRYAHARGVIHRDIKPENVLVGKHGEVYVVDWGIARTHQPAHPVESPVEALGPDGATERGLIGTPAYMAPEQIFGRQERVDERTDLYCLGATLYEFLTLNYYLGDVEDGFPRLMHAVLEHRPRDAERFRDSAIGRVPRPLSRVCRKALSKSPEQRFQTAAEFAGALQDWLEGKAPVVCPGTWIQRMLARYHRLIDNYPILAPAFSIAVLVLLLGWLVFSAVLFSSWLGAR